MNELRKKLHDTIIGTGSIRMDVTPSWSEVSGLHVDLEIFDQLVEFTVEGFIDWLARLPGLEREKRLLMEKYLYGFLHDFKEDKL